MSETIGHVAGHLTKESPRWQPFLHLWLQSRSMRLSGHRALITGASSGIGRAIAVALVEEGAEVLLIGRDPGRLDALARELGPGSHPHPLDLADDRQLDAAAEAAGPSLDLLIHSAGLAELGSIDKAAIGALDRMWSVNLRAPVLLTQRCLPALRAARGQIVFINSGAGLVARAGWGHYAATKFALRAVADALREELRADGVRVLSVFPGRTATAMQAEVHRQEGQIYHPERFMQPGDVAAMIVAALVLPRTAHVHEINLRHEEGRAG
jgi:NADP-dependent 3-hydroxy acid dehydrogenase YdfG